jgi:hypothetical protein
MATLFSALDAQLLGVHRTIGTWTLLPVLETAYEHDGLAGPDGRTTFSLVGRELR